MIRRSLVAVAALAGCHASPSRPPPCPSAPVSVHGQAQLDALSACRVLAGLELRTAAALDLAPLARLTRIERDLIIGPTLAVSTLRLPALASIGGALRIAGNADLSGVYLPSLTSIAGTVAITDDLALVQVSAPALRTIGGDVTIARTPALELIDTSAQPRVTGRISVDAPRLITWVGAPTSAPL